MLFTTYSSAYVVLPQSSTYFGNGYVAVGDFIPQQDKYDNYIYIPRYNVKVAPLILNENLASETKQFIYFSGTSIPDDPTHYYPRNYFMFEADSDIGSRLASANPSSEAVEFISSFCTFSDLTAAPTLTDEFVLYVSSVEESGGHYIAHTYWSSQYCRLTDTESSVVPGLGRLAILTGTPDIAFSSSSNVNIFLEESGSYRATYLPKLSGEVGLREMCRYTISSVAFTSYCSQQQNDLYINEFTSNLTWNALYDTHAIYKGTFVDTADRFTITNFSSAFFEYSGTCPSPIEKTSFLELVDLYYKANNGVLSHIHDITSLFRSSILASSEIDTRTVAIVYNTPYTFTFTPTPIRINAIWNDYTIANLDNFYDTVRPSGYELPDWYGCFRHLRARSGIGYYIKQTTSSPGLVTHVIEPYSSCQSRLWTTAYFTESSRFTVEELTELRHLQIFADRTNGSFYVPDNYFEEVSIPIYEKYGYPGGTNLRYFPRCYDSAQIVGDGSISNTVTSEFYRPRWITEDNCVVLDDTYNPPVMRMLSGFDRTAVAYFSDFNSLHIGIVDYLASRSDYCLHEGLPLLFSSQRPFIDVNSNIFGFTNCTLHSVMTLATSMAEPTSNFIQTTSNVKWSVEGVTLNTSGFFQATPIQCYAVDGLENMLAGLPYTSVGTTSFPPSTIFSYASSNLSFVSLGAFLTGSGQIISETLTPYSGDPICFVYSGQPFVSYTSNQYFPILSSFYDVSSYGYAFVAPSGASISDVSSYANWLDLGTYMAVTTEYTSAFTSAFPSSYRQVNYFDDMRQMDIRGSSIGTTPFDMATSGDFQHMWNNIGSDCYLWWTDYFEYNDKLYPNIMFTSDLRGIKFSYNRHLTASITSYV